MKILLALLFCVTSFVQAEAQKYITKNGFISFFSSTPVEDIKAENNQVASVLDISTGELVYQVLIKAFHFEKSLMQEHFNENYMESDKFPKAGFKGKIINSETVDFKKNGTYRAKVEGDLTIRNVTKKIEAEGTINVEDEGISSNAKFIISPEDYGIKIPRVVRENIAKSIVVTVVTKYTEM